MRKNQTGTSLVAVLFTLICMALISLAGLRVAINDIAIANNYQKILTVYQAAESTLRKDVSFYSLLQWKTDNLQQLEGIDSTNVISKTVVIDLEKDYTCNLLDNQASSLGPDVPRCELYRFEVKSQLKGTGARDTHYQGVGKQVPSQSTGGYL